VRPPLAISLPKRRECPDGLAFGVDRLAATLGVLAPIRDEPPAERIERYLASLVVAPDHQQVLARRAIPPRRIVVDAAIADVHSVHDRRRLLEKVKVIGPRINLNRLAASISVEICERIGSSWDEWFGLLMRFKEREGHCRVPFNHVEGGFNLGTWVVWQRRHRDTMSAKRKQRLDAMGFVWDLHERDWEEGFAALATFKAREGHCRVPDRYIEGMYRLGQWVGVQRSKKEFIPVDRRQRLNAIGFV
jgi:hypothetical protein